MRGRKPKPTQQQLNDGDPRKLGVRKLKAKLAAEPRAQSGLPSCPRHLTGRARSAWKFWATELALMDLDRRPDAQMLEGACVNYARAVKADLIVSREGIMRDVFGQTEAGEPFLLKTQYHPAITVSNAAWRQVRAFCSEFGLSPVSRTRLAIERKDQSERELAALLQQPRSQHPPVTVQ